MARFNLNSFLNNDRFEDFFAQFTGGGTGHDHLNGTTAGKPRKLLPGRYGRLRTVVRAPDGSLWVATSNRDGRGDPKDGDDRIVRLRP